MENAVIVSAARTPVGSLNGSLVSVGTVDLGKLVIAETLNRAGVESGLVDEVVMGNVLQAGLGQNPARQAALAAGLADSVPAYTVNKVCGSGLKTVALAAQSIAAQNAEVVIAGGMENMTRAPYLLDSRARWGYRMGNQQVIDRKSVV